MNLGKEKEPRKGLTKNPRFSIIKIVQSNVQKNKIEKNENVNKKRARSNYEK